MVHDVSGGRKWKARCMEHSDIQTGVIGMQCSCTDSTLMLTFTVKCTSRFK